ncbi:hypothetical protein I4I84_10715 [Pseudonocardia sp. KRD-182]|uniref:hypothetical protein n=1 Tax=Pseudonocardia oceani TaxID=2792013 RepID=UPI001C49E1E5|nr:hypothetical protein [Pseudonocardia oceani]MBW0109193.1 hypothetical protein [Pseudonocardia oceani]
MTTLQAVLIFAGTPVAILGAIAAVVFTAAPRSPGRSPNLPVGLSIEPHPCVIETTDDGQTHEPSARTSATARCSTVRCAECGAPYTEGTNPVHFRDPAQAISVTTLRRWRLAGARMRCPACA